MSSRLDRLARRVEDDPAFMASVLAIYARSEGMDDAALARALGCSADQLASLRLCFRPRSEPAYFRRDVQEIAAYFGIEPEVLAAIVRRADSLAPWQPLGERAARSVSPLIAARDREEARERAARDDRGAPPPTAPAEP
jgi:hypothetical protein